MNSGSLLSDQKKASVVQDDWDAREFTETAKLNIMKLVQFLNQFDISTREKLEILNEKLGKLERVLQYVEAAMFDVVQNTEHEKAQAELEVQE